MSIEVRDLHFGYGPDEVLRGVSFTAKTGELTSVLGPNGVGKSTLFRCMLGLLRGYRGQITVEGAETAGLNAKKLARLIAYIPQSHAPSFPYSVFHMVLMGTTAQVGPLASPGAKQREAAERALELAGVTHLRDKSYGRISGGERQLVLIARAIVQDSRVLVLDEPAANLDYGNQLHVMEVIRKLTDGGYTVIQSTHNPEQAFLFSHSIVALRGGRVLAEGKPAEVVTEGLMRELYGADISVCSLFEDKIRVCVPKFVIESK